jgi:glycogen debranching enzyme
LKPFLQVADQYYVLATSVLADRETRVLKQGETFAIFDSYGDIQPVTHAESGVFHRGTRHLSHLEFNVFGDNRPLLLNSTLRDDNGLLKIDLTNRDLVLPSAGFVPKGTLYIHREKFLLDATCFEQVEISNYGPIDVKVDFSYRMGADFKDIFEVRGTRREKRGEQSALKREGDQVTVEYQGLDGIQRTTSFQFSVADFTFEHETVRFALNVPSRKSVNFQVNVAFRQESQSIPKSTYKEGLEKIHSDHHAGRKRYCSLRTSNEQFDGWMRRSTDDLVMMTTQTPSGELYPYAGIPWFCAAFGRDGIITAMQTLWANPALSKGVLEFLAKTQAQEHVAERDATPGKIIHEIRRGEMANLKEIPFGLYYGSVDSTPLFLCLTGMYLSRTGDNETIKRIWPAIEKAIFWLDRYGDLDGDGFIEYQRENPNGLVQQGWKDSHDSVFHADGSDARGPIALCEVQAYAYMARIEAAKAAEVTGHHDLADDLRKKAADLKEKFDQSFWLDDLGTYALALDGQKKPCRVFSSNAGQCLFTGIVKPERAEILAKNLMMPESFSGWGVRTISTDAIRYNPMSYHNGSVWPHDCSLIAWGLAKYGYKNEVERIFSGLFRSALYMEQVRMPEVFCGFLRREGEAPTLYPHACSPQAWAAGSVYLMIQSLLGLSIHAGDKRVMLEKPVLPEAIETMRISGLEVDGSTVDLVVQNYHSDVSVQIVHRSPGVSIAVLK